MNYQKKNEDNDVFTIVESKTLENNEDKDFDNLYGDYKVKLIISDSDENQLFFVEPKEEDSNELTREFTITNSNRSEIYDFQYGLEIPHLSSGAVPTMEYDIPVTISLKSGCSAFGVTTVVELIDEVSQVVGSQLITFGVSNGAQEVIFRDVTVAEHNEDSKIYSLRLKEQYGDVVTYTESITNALELKEASPLTCPSVSFNSTVYSSGTIENPLVNFTLDLQGDENITYYVYKVYYDEASSQNIWSTPITYTDLNAETVTRQIISGFYPSKNYRILILDRELPTEEVERNTLLTSLTNGDATNLGRGWISESENFEVVPTTISTKEFSNSLTTDDTYQLICHDDEISIKFTLASTINGYEQPYYYFGTSPPTKIEEFQLIEDFNALSIATIDHTSRTTFGEGDYQLYLMENQIYGLHGSEESPYGYYEINSFTLSQPDPIAIDLTITSSYPNDDNSEEYHVSRHNGTDGEIGVETSGGVPNFAITLSNNDEIKNGTITEHFSDLPLGEYTISSIEDTYGCMTIVTNDVVTLRAPNPVEIEEFTSTKDYGGLGLYDISVSGGNDGEIRFSAVNGIPNYEATLYISADNNTFQKVGTALTSIEESSERLYSNLSKGFYQLIVTDKYFNQDLPEQYTTENVNTITTDDTATNGDIVISDVIELKEPEPLKVTITSLKNYQTVIDSADYHVKCNFGEKARTGIAYIIVEGGIPYSDVNRNYYRIVFNRKSIADEVEFDVVINAGKWSTSNSLNQLVEGVLTVEVFDSQENTHSDNDELIAPYPLEIVYKAPIKPSCIDGDDGLIQLEIKGGIHQSATESYELTFGNTSIGFNELSTFTQAEGDKAFILKDKYDCPCDQIKDDDEDYTASFYQQEKLEAVQQYTKDAIDNINNDRGNVNEPTSLLYYLSDFFPFSVRVVSDSTNCYNASDGLLTVKDFYGGAGEEYTLQIRKGNTAVHTTPNVLASDEVIYEGLNAGTYTLFLTDNECGTYRAIDTVFVTEYKGPTGRTLSNDASNLGQADVREPDPLIATILPIETNCYGTNSGALDFNITGGHLPYTITIEIENTANNGGYDERVYSETITTNNVLVENLLGNKNYKIHVTDLMSCEVETRYINAVELIEEDLYYGIYYVPERPIVNVRLSREIAVKDQTCAGVEDGSIIFTTLGNPTNTLFRWIDNNGNTTNEIAVIDPYLVEQLTWDNLPNGDYTLQYLENNGCAWKTTNRIKTIGIQEDLRLSIDKLFQKGENDFEAHLYINNVGSFLIVEQQQVNGSWLAIHQGIVNNEEITFTALSNGIYKFTLNYADTPNCGEVSEILDTSTAALTAFGATIITQNPTCGDNPDGTAIFTLINRVNADIRTIRWLTENGQEISRSSEATNLTQGNYQLELTDNNDIVIIEDFTLTSPDELSIIDQLVTSPLCVDGSSANIKLNVFFGSGNYKYIWSSDSFSDLVTSEGNLNNIGVGDYAVTIQDEENEACEILTNITVPEADTVQVKNMIITNPTYYGAENGAVELVISGGEKPYIVYWGDQNVYGNKLENIAIGEYAVTITDKNNCVKDTVIQLTEQPEEMLLSVISTEDVSCFGANDGSAQVAITGGTSPYSIHWSNNQRGEELRGVGVGTYTAFVTDNVGHVKEFNVQIDGNTQISTSIVSKTNPLCVGSADGTLTVEIIGGSGTYTFDLPSTVQVEREGNNYTFYGFVDGNYAITIMDENGCTNIIYNQRFVDPSPMLIDSVIVITPTCNGAANGAISVSISGGSGNYAYQWDKNDSGLAIIENIEAGIYTLSVIDIDRGCTFSKAFALGQPDVLAAVFATVIPPLCFGKGGGVLEVEVTGGTAPYAYLWSNGDTTAMSDALTAGNYSVIITDAKNCSITIENELHAPPEIVIDVPNLEELIEICEGSFFSLNAGDEWSEVQWTSDRGFSSFEREVIITGAGVYQLSVTNHLGCRDSVSFTVEERDDLLNANFVVETSPEYSIDSYFIIDLSWPLPDVIEWSYSPEVNIVSATDHEQEIRFLNSGLHTITLKATLGNCIAEINRDIEVVILDNGRLGVKEKVSELELEKEVTNFNVYPNPSSGELSIDIQLSDNMDATLKLLAIGDAKVVWSKELKNKETYTIKYQNDKLPTGVYLLQLTTRQSVEVQKVMIIKN